MTLDQISELLATLNSQLKATNEALHELTARVVKIESNPTAITPEQLAALEHVKTFLGATA